MAKKNGSDYSVGYKKPPQHTQFKPGQSGNTKGRPKKDKNVVEVVLKELRSSLIVNVGSKRQRITKLEAIVKQHVNKAASGDPKSTAIVLDVLKPAESNQDNKLPELLQEFREKNARHVAADRKREQATDDDGSTELATSPPNTANQGS